MVTGTTSGIAETLFGETRRGILSLLFMRPGEEFHLRRIVRLTGAGVGPVQRELAALAQAGLVQREVRGSNVCYRANFASPVFQELQGIITKTAGAADVLRKALAPEAARIKVAFVFGSVARGKQDGESDLDLFIISDALTIQRATGLLRQAQRQLAREINPIIYTRREFRERTSANHHFIAQVLRDNKVFLIGDEDELRRLG